jgi:hypothetical protein
MVVCSATLARVPRRPAAWALITAAALLSGTGCQNSPNWFAKKDAGISRLNARSVPYLSGVPVPSGFQIAERLTDAYESSGVRFARQEYAGNAEPAAIREFYREQMPLLGWREISSHDIKGRLSMRFENNHEECNLTIEPAGWFSRSSIQVVVKPFKRSASEPPAKRPMP